ncbi:MAG: FMN-binding protein [Turicibacter sp.]|nr:FMN-binding protein [Turicibacter sp.]
MKNNKKLIFLPVLMVAAIALSACGNLSDEDSIWNQTRDDDGAGPAGSGSAAMTFEAGTFEATSEIRGFGGPMEVVVTIGADGAIQSIEVTEHGESEAWYDMAVPTLTDAIINAGSANVDGVSGATYTSTAFLNAVEIALSQAGGAPAADGGAAGSADFTPGTFEATSEIRGFGGPMEVVVTIAADGAIESIEVTEHGESDNWYDMAVPTLTTAIINAQSADVDGIAGATYTSNAFINAVQIALNAAE